MPNSSVVIRNYQPSDFNNYVQLHVETEQIVQSGRTISARQLAELLGRPNFSPDKDLYVAESDGKIIGYISISLEFGIERALLICLVHPHYRKKGTATQLFDQALRHSTEAGIKSAQVSISESNAAAKSLVTHLGFRYIRYFLELKLDLSNRRLPSGNAGEYTSRALQPGEEELLTEIQNRFFAGAWGFNPNTTEEIIYRVNMSGSSHEDIIIAYLGDKPVGYCWMRINAQENPSKTKPQGQIHMMGVDPDYRNKGIGKDVILNALSHLKRKGIEWVELTVDGENQTARAVYESVGFKVWSRTLWYEKKLT